MNNLDYRQQLARALRDRSESEAAQQRQRSEAIERQRQIDIKLAFQRQTELRETAAKEKRVTELQIHLGSQVKSAAMLCANALQSQGIAPERRWIDSTAGIWKRTFVGNMIGVWLVSLETSSYESRQSGPHGTYLSSSVGRLKAIGLATSGRLLLASAEKESSRNIGENGYQSPPPPVYPDVSHLSVKGDAGLNDLIKREDIDPTRSAESHTYIVNAWQEKFIELAAGNLNLTED